MTTDEFSKYYRTIEEANFALSQWDKHFFELDLELIYMAVIKSTNDRYNFEIEFGRKKTGLLQPESITKEDREQFEVEFPEFLPLVNKNLPQEEQNLDETFIKVSLVWTEKVSAIDSDPSANFDFDPILQGGRSVSNQPFDMGGTLGAIFTLKNHDGFFGLSNKHVLQDNCENRGDEIYNPRVYDIPSSEDLNNYLSGVLIWEQFKPYLDAAIYKINNEHRIVTKLKNGIQLQNINRCPKLHLNVTKCGYKTNTLSGCLRSLNTTLKVEIDGRDELFFKQIQITKISTSGDSGSIVYDDDQNVVGLLFADDKNRSDGYTYANDINNLFNFTFPEVQYLFDSNGNVSFEKLELKTFI